MAERHCQATNQKIEDVIIENLNGDIYVTMFIVIIQIVYLRKI